MKKILTVSVAAYNVENVIEQCLNSFIQMKHVDDIEIIVTDDGSTDATKEHVQTYADKYPNSIRLISKENGGHGSTINTALSFARGKYFKIVDGDDWIDPKAADRLVEFLENSEADLVLSNYTEVYPQKKRFINMVANWKVGELYTFKNTHIYDFIPMHACTIKLDSYKTASFPISEHCFYVDTEFIFYMVMATKKITFCDANVYQYRLGSETQSVSADGIYRHIEDMIFVVKHLLDVYKSVAHGPTIDSYTKAALFNFLNTRYRMVFYWFSKMKNNNKDYLLEKFYRETMEAHREYIKKFNLGIYQYIPYCFKGGLFCIRLVRKIVGK